MNPLTLVKSRLLAILLAGVCLSDIFAMTGCVYPVGGEVFVGPPPVLGPSLNIGLYGTPAGYYYQNYPVFVYRAGQHTTTAEGDIITVQATAIIIDVDTATIIESRINQFNYPQKL